MTKILALLASLLFIVTGCTAPDSSETGTVDERTPADPSTDEGTGGQAPTCEALTCSDALDGKSGAFCPESDRLIDALEVCNERHCEDACDDNAFRTLSDPAKAEACRACLDEECPKQVKACEHDHAPKAPTGLGAS